MDAGPGNFGGEEVLLSVDTGIQPTWAVCVFIALILVCIAVTVWFPSDGSGKR